MQWPLLLFTPSEYLSDICNFLSSMIIMQQLNLDQPKATTYNHRRPQVVDKVRQRVVKDKVVIHHRNLTSTKPDLTKPSSNSWCFWYCASSHKVAIQTKTNSKSWHILLISSCSWQVRTTQIDKRVARSRCGKEDQHGPVSGQKLI